MRSNATHAIRGRTRGKIRPPVQPGASGTLCDASLSPSKFYKYVINPTSKTCFFFLFSHFEMVINNVLITIF